MRKESLLDEVFTAISSNLSSQINLARLLELLLGEDANFVISVLQATTFYEINKYQNGTSYFIST